MAKNYVRVCAVLIGLRSLTNFGKLTNPDAVMVFFGSILKGSDLVIPSLAVGLFMLATCVAMLASARAALPMLATYSAYVMFNMLSWSIWQSDQFFRVGGMLSSASDPNALWWRGVAGMIGYSTVAIATTAVPAYLIWRDRNSNKLY